MDYSSTVYDSARHNCKKLMFHVFVYDVSSNFERLFVSLPEDCSIGSVVANKYRVVSVHNRNTFDSFGVPVRYLWVEKLP